MMARRSSTTLLAVLLSVGCPTAHGAPGRPPADETPMTPLDRTEATIELLAMPADFEVLVDWAASLYAEAGLGLPPLRITHHGEDPQPCRGSTGWHHHRDGISHIDICTTNGGLLAERLVLHELAHAWQVHGLTDDGLRAFRELRGWTHWLGHDEVSWFDLGAEQAAEIIAWGLSDRPIRPILGGQSGCDDLDAGYRALTGRPPLHGLPDRC